MKILHVTQNYYPSIGGTQHTIKRISEYLHEMYGDEIVVLTTNSHYGPNKYQFKKIAEKEEIVNGIKVRRFPFAKMHKSVFRFLSKLSVKVFKKTLPDFFDRMQHGPVSFSMLKAINSSTADVVGASSIHYLFADYPIWRKRFSNAKPFVMYGALHLHNKEISHRYIKRVQAADYYIANTSYEKDYLVGRGIEEEKIKIIGTATNILEKADFTVTTAELKNKYNLPPQKIIITFIGRQEISKGIPVLLKAFFKTAERFADIYLIVAGATGGYTNELKYIIKDNNSILLLSDITDLQKTEILRVTDFLVLPSIEESFGLVFLEAWSFKKAVIGANIHAVASVIDDGENGLLFTPGDSEDLSQKMEFLIKNETLRIAAGLNGYDKITKNFTWDIVAKKFRDVYALAIEKYNSGINNKAK